MALVKKEINDIKEIPYVITVDNNGTNRDIGVFRSTIGDNMDGLTIQVNIFDNIMFDKEFKNNKKDIQDYFFKFLKQTLKEGINRGHYYMQGVYDILNDKKVIEFCGNGYDYSENEVND